MKTIFITLAGGALYLQIKGIGEDLHPVTGAFFRLCRVSAQQQLTNFTLSGTGQSQQTLGLLL